MNLYILIYQKFDNSFNYFEFKDLRNYSSVVKVFNGDLLLSDKPKFKYFYLLEYNGNNFAFYKYSGNKNKYIIESKFTSLSELSEYCSQFTPEIFDFIINKNVLSKDKYLVEIQEEFSKWDKQTKTDLLSPEECYDIYTIPTKDVFTRKYVNSSAFETNFLKAIETKEYKSVFGSGLNNFLGYFLSELFKVVDNDIKILVLRKIRESQITKILLNKSKNKDYPNHIFKYLRFFYNENENVQYELNQLALKFFKLLYGKVDENFEYYHYILLLNNFHKKTDVFNIINMVLTKMYNKNSKFSTQCAYFIFYTALKSERMINFEEYIKYINKWAKMNNVTLNFKLKLKKLLINQGYILNLEELNFLTDLIEI